MSTKDLMNDAHHLLEVAWKKEPQKISDRIIQSEQELERVAEKYLTWKKIVSELKTRVVINKEFGVLEVLLILMTFQSLMEIFVREVLNQYLFFSTIVHEEGRMRNKHFLGNIIKKLEHNCTATNHLEFADFCQEINNCVMLRNAIAHMDFKITDDLSVILYTGDAQNSEFIVVSVIEINNKMIEGIENVLGLISVLSEFLHKYEKEGNWEDLLQKY